MGLSHLTPSSGLFGVLPTGDAGWVYYAVCALFFLLMGLFCGFLIWRRGNLQTLDAESEVKKASQDLQDLREDLRTEESVLRTDEEGEEGERAISSSRE